MLKHKNSLWALLLMIASCSLDEKVPLALLEEKILARPLIGSVDFYSPVDTNLRSFNTTNGFQNFYFISQFTDSMSNGFYGPVTPNFDFEQFISFDILTEADWSIENQMAYKGRLVQNAKKGVFNVKQTLFFADSLNSICVYEIVNTSDQHTKLNVQWKYSVPAELKHEKRKGFQGIRLLTESAEYWPHTSGKDVLTFNTDSTEVYKKVFFPNLFPGEKIALYAVIHIHEQQAEIKGSPRPKPFLYFPEEELVKNTKYWSKKIN